LRLDKRDYEEQLVTEQARLAGLLRDKRMRRHALVAVFEGNDAAGKGGAIRRVAAALDPRQYRIVPIAAPTEEERAQPYLWRFWRHIPARGKFTIFDRSWYGRVLVERVEGFCSPADWMRAYSEINDFEEQLRNAGWWWSSSGWPSTSRPSWSVSRARADPVQALQDHRGRLAQPRQVGRLQRSGGRHGRPHQHRDRAVDPGGGQRQALGAGEGAAHHQRGAGSGVCQAQEIVSRRLPRTAAPADTIHTWEQSIPWERACPAIVFSHAHRNDLMNSFPATRPRPDAATP
jgi:hypothetical protein